MSAALASVQTAQDASIPASLVVFAVLALVLLVVALTLPDLIRRWRHAGRVIHRMPLPPTDHFSSTEATPRKKVSHG